jgi:hypothetical protein
MKNPPRQPALGFVPEAFSAKHTHYFTLVNYKMVK